MTELRDQPPPPGYWPNTPSQWREATVDDCTWYATEFAFESGSTNHLSMHPVEDLRAKSTDTHGGTPVVVAVRDTAALWPKSENVGWKYSAYTLQEITRALSSGAVLVVGGDYEKLPPHYRRWTNNDRFAHAVAVKFILNGRTRMYDPLGGGPTNEPYNGEWILLEEIFGGPDNYGWRNANGDYYVAIVQNMEDNVIKELFIDQDRPATRMMRVKDKTPVYANPSVTSERIKTYWNPDVWRWLFGNAGPGWRATLAKNADDRWTLGYVQVEDIIETKDTPIPPDEDVEAYKRVVAELNATLDRMRVDLASAEDKLDNIDVIIHD